MGKTIKNYENYLETIYYNPEHAASFSGIDKLYRSVRSEGKAITKGQLKKWLRGQSVYNGHKPVRKTFKRRRVISQRKWYQFDGDTVSMTRYRKNNHGYAYILVLIDVTSKYAWTRPLKTLKGKEMVETLKSLKMKKPENLRTDKGSEFINSDFKRYIDLRGINHYSTTNEKKANFAERFIKTLKSRIMKYMHKSNSHEWVAVLPKITESYNNTHHRTIDMSPSQALKTDDVTLWKKIYQPPSEKRTNISKFDGPRRKNPYKFKVGDKVKLSFIKEAFAKEYDSKWTDEYFVITSRSIGENIPQYRIKDWENDIIDGRFYEQELQKIDLPEEDNTVYKIEKILKRRTRKGVKEVFVHWEGWHKRFRSLIPASEVENI